MRRSNAFALMFLLTWAWLRLQGGGIGPAPLPERAVLIVEESSKRHELPLPQQEIMAGAKTRGYLDAHFPKWRIFDSDTDLSKVEALWQEAMKRPRTAIPWLIVSNGRTGHEGVLPADADSTIRLLERYK